MRSLTDIKGFLVDLDGTLVHGRTALPGAAAFLATLEQRFVIISNDAEHTPPELSRHLGRLGLDVPARRIVLAGTTALDDIALRRPGARILLLAGPSLARYAAGLGLVPVTAEPEVVLIGRDRRFSYGRLAVAANALRDGAELVVANPDLVHPGPGGSVVPETGALLAALLACTGPIPYRVVGKPEPSLYEAGLALLGLQARNALMVGDNPATDGEGARRLGMGYLEISGGLEPLLSALPEAGVPAVPVRSAIAVGTC